MRGVLKRGYYEEKILGGLFRRFNHVLAFQPSFTNSIDPITSPPLSLPETESGFRLQFPGVAPDLRSLDLMAVPKQKISKRRRGIRNGPKALKPIPVIVRCTCCGRVKLPHFYCCSGRKEEPGERTDN